MGRKFLFGCLGFYINEDEYDLDGIWAEPLDEVVLALIKNDSYVKMIENFPDLSNKVMFINNKYKIFGDKK